MDETTLAAAVERARSLEEIEAALASQQRVVSVRLADYLLKSWPPQREFIVSLASDEGPVTTIVNVLDLGDGRFRLNRIRDG